MTKPIPNLESQRQFIFEVPLYAKYSVEHCDKVLWSLYRHSLGAGRTVRIDGWCVACNRETPFSLSSTNIPGGAPTDNIYTRKRRDEINATCTRCSKVIWVEFHIIDRIVEKVGQFPSLADIANDEIKQFRKIIPKEWAAELHRAIGLAAHGVGVGSYVYLRRIFENLINRRFEEHKDQENWSEDEFYNNRMDEKIQFLSNFLPNVLVENRKMYSFLSKGIHELSEDECLEFFEVLKRGTILILKDEQAAREDEAERTAFAEAIAKASSAQKAKDQNVKS